MFPHDRAANHGLGRVPRNGTEKKLALVSKSLSFFAPVSDPADMQRRRRLGIDIDFCENDRDLTAVGSVNNRLRSPGRITVVVFVAECCELTVVESVKPSNNKKNYELYCPPLP